MSIQTLSPNAVIPHGHPAIAHLPVPPKDLYYWTRMIPSTQPEGGGAITSVYMTTGCFAKDAPDQKLPNLRWVGTLVADFDLADYFAATVLVGEKGEKARASVVGVKTKDVDKVLMYRAAAAQPEGFARLVAKFEACICETTAKVTAIEPTYLNWSGWGYHGYWHLQASDCPADMTAEQIAQVRAENAELVGRINQAARFNLADVGVHDAGTRILRPLGTVNAKDIRGPSTVRVHSSSSSRWVLGASLLAPELDISDLECDPAVVAATQAAMHAAPASELTEPPVGMPAAVEALLLSSPQARNLFEGKGKPVKSKDGKPLDLSSSGYDLSFGMLLGKKGIAAADIAAAVYLRNGRDLRAANRVAERVMQRRGVAPAPAPGALPLLTTKSGAPLTCVGNTITVIEQDPTWAGELVYDEMFERITLHGIPLTDEVVTKARKLIGEKHGFEPGKEMAHDAFATVAKDHRVNHLTDYLKAQKWDGLPRVEKVLIDHLGVEDTPLHRAYARCFLVSAVARAFEPGCQVRLVLTITGPQNWGKSKFFRILAGDAYFLDSVIELEHKDGASILRGKWICEFGEMRGLNKHGVETQKAYLSRQEDTYRPAYGRQEVTIPRRCIFGATTNEAYPLIDATGNSRFMPVRITASYFDAPALLSVRDQIWAEAVQMYQDGVRWYLSDEEMGLQTVAGEDFVTESVSTAECLTWAQKQIAPFTLAMCITEGLGIPVDQVRKHEREVVQMLTHNGFVCGTNATRVDGVRARRWSHPDMPGPYHDPSVQGDITKDLEN